VTEAPTTNIILLDAIRAPDIQIDTATQIICSRPELLLSTITGTNTNFPTLSREHKRIFSNILFPMKNTECQLAKFTSIQILF
ncbi:hypothetical protein D9F44_14690, partial [Escherichia coli]|nr:hypothetical protein [Escherichia coli]